jgi:hypothetical protein
MQTFFEWLIPLQFLLVALHDWVNIPGLTSATRVQSVIGKRKLLVVTLVNSSLPGLAVFFAIHFRNTPAPLYVKGYWFLYCVGTVLSGIAMWYIPYFFGASEEKTREYAAMYAGTRFVFPSRGNNPRPNALHFCFHILFLTTFLLSAAILLG